MPIIVLYPARWRGPILVVLCWLMVLGWIVQGCGAAGPFTLSATPTYPPRALFVTPTPYASPYVGISQGIATRLAQTAIAPH